VTGVAFGFADGPTAFENLGDLVVEFDAVRHDHERPIARNPPQNLLREKHHREALAAALGLPEDAAASAAFRARLHRGDDGVIDAEELVILAENFGEPRLVLGEEREVFDQVEETGRLARAAKHDLQ
jgi:hypothetical protein